MNDSLRRKKLIEVALPLDVVNDASAYDKMPGIGPHPKGIHHWWARLPLPCARAILFASLVDDPSSDPAFAGRSEGDQELERERLFDVIRGLCEKKAYQRPELFEAARAEILRACEGSPPAVVDPFCGGGSIPLEAQRLGLEAHGSDLNPVAVLISRAAIEIVPRFVGMAPVHPDARRQLAHSGTWEGAAGLAADVRQYGAWIRIEAEKHLGELYPKVDLPSPHAGGQVAVIAWIWARTVRCPNPACAAEMPLVSSFALATKDKKAKQRGQKDTWIVPCVNRDSKTVSYEVRAGDGCAPPPTKVGRQRASFRCVVCDQVAQNPYIRAEGRAGRMGTRLMAIIAEGQRGRTYLSPTPMHEEAARKATPRWVPTTSLPEQGLGFRVQAYGITEHSQMFTRRQLAALTTLTDLVGEVHSKVLTDFLNAVPEGLQLTADAYADAVTTFLAFSIDRLADYNCALSTWKPSGEQQMHLYGRSAVPMVWDFTEANVLGEKAICWKNAVDITADAIQTIPTTAVAGTAVHQVDAAGVSLGKARIVISTDPPYYDSIGYSDLSDFFYVWLRRSLSKVHPDLFGTMVTPKTEELIAEPYRFGGSNGAKQHFEAAFRRVFASLKAQLDPRFPMTVYYAFKQKDEEGPADDDDAESLDTRSATSGWETLLEALVSSGFQITGTWPVRASQKWRMRAMGSNALASYIVLVCRSRPSSALIATKREFVNALRGELENALLPMMHGSIPPVDLAQASIGPGMSVYSRYARVEETDGRPVSVRTALLIINQELNTILGGFDDHFDADTRFCLGWFEHHGMDAGPYGDALTLATARGTTPESAQRAGCVEAKLGQVRLLRREEYPSNWEPQTDARLVVWESTQHLVHALEKTGEAGAARLCSKLGSTAELARDLAYRLFSMCERKGLAQEALAYNSLVISWPEITRLSGSVNLDEPQTGLFAVGEL